MKKMTFNKVAVMTATPIATMFLANSAHADEQYTVQAGDNLYDIAAKFGTTATKIAADNGISNMNQLYVGQQLTINNESNAQATETYSVAQNSNKVSSNTTENTSSAKEWIANKESGGSYSARNGRYVGRYQLDASYLNGDYSEENQERVANRYVKERYGSWEQAKAFHQANGWY